MVMMEGALMCWVPAEDSNTSLEEGGDCKVGACSVLRETEKAKAKLHSGAVV